jgi:hypothetical protein
MEAHPTISVGRTYVPNSYEVALNPADFAEFEPFRHSLEHNMAEFISDLATERGYSLVSRPRVTLKSDKDVPKRSIEVDARLTDEPAASALSNAPTVRTDAPGLTAVAGGAPAEPVIDRTHAMPMLNRNRAHPAQTVRPSVAPPAAYLQPVGGDMAGRDFTLNKTLVSIGRGLDNDLVIDDPRVSRHHAQITFRHSHYLLRDQRSTNGTFVNGQPVETVVLASGDRVSIGGYELIFTQE